MPPEGTALSTSRREFEWRVGQGRGAGAGQGLSAPSGPRGCDLHSSQHPRTAAQSRGGHATLPPPPCYLRPSAVRATGVRQQHSVPRSSVSPSQLLLVPRRRGRAVFTLRTSLRPPSTRGSWAVPAGPPLGFALREGLGPRGQLPRDPKDSALSVLSGAQAPQIPQLLLCRCA